MKATNKRGFTMIELIFVIVILGILAAVALPKLSATRNDAIATTASQEAKTLIKDLGAYYTSQGDFNATLPNLTNVPVVAKNFAGGLPAAFNNGTGDVVYKVRDVDCIGFSLTSSDGNVTVTAAPITANNAICDEVYSMLDINGTTNIFGGRKIKF